MRLALLYNPGLLLERLGAAAKRRRRLKKLRGTVAADLQLGHIESLELLELLRERPPKVIYDIGANVGTWTLLTKAIYPKAEVHSFEPLEIHNKAFSQVTRVLSDVHLHSVALGSRNGTEMMNVASFSDASSFLKPIQACQNQLGIESVRPEEIPIVKLDDYVVEHRLPLPDLIKLDVQGYELEVLKGATNCLANTGAVISEVSFVEYYAGQGLFHELANFCATFGFFVAALSAGTTLGKPLTQSDVLFLKSSVSGNS